MAQRWFKKWGWIYQPIHPAGWIVTLFPILILLQICVGIDARTHSVSDAVYAVFPWTVLLFLLWNWIASKTSK